MKNNTEKVATNVTGITTFSEAQECLRYRKNELKALLEMSSALVEKLYNPESVSRPEDLCHDETKLAQSITIESIPQQILKVSEDMDDTMCRISANLEKIFAMI